MNPTTSARTHTQRDHARRAAAALAAINAWHAARTRPTECGHHHRHNTVQVQRYALTPAGAAAVSSRWAR